MAQQTNLRRTAERATGDLAKFIQTRRAKGVSWRAMARELDEKYGVAVSYQTLVIWFDETEQAAS